MRHEGKGQNVPASSHELPEPVRDISPELHDTAAPDHDRTLEDIRDLLFGTSVPDYERRLATLDTRLQQVEVDLREEFRRRCDALEHYMKSEFESLHAQLRMEQGQHVSYHELQDLLLEQSTRLTHELGQKSAEISSLLEEKLHALYQDKTGLASLATLFCDAGLRLKQHDPSLGATGKRARHS